MTTQTFETILWLDDMRTPLSPGVKVVRNYKGFVAYLESLAPGDFPDLISFDHDLALEHYPRDEAEQAKGIPYHTIRSFEIPYRVDPIPGVGIDGWRL